MTEPITDADLIAVITPLYALAGGITKVVSGKAEVNRLAVLQAVAGAPGIRPSQIASALNLHLSQTTRQVQALVDEGLLDVAVDPHDGRSRLLTLTPAGGAAMQQLTAIGMRKWHAFVAGWEPADVRRLGDLLDRLHTAIVTTNSRTGRSQP